MTGLLKTLVREPLVHFLLLGAAIFAGYSLVSRNASGEPGRIVITRAQLASMMVGFNRTWQRPPTPEEWEGLVRDRVREEVYYREALALELDKDDLIIRRRLRQKMEFVTDDVTARAQPTDSELQAFLQAHPDTFRVDPRFTFRQLYLSPQKHGDHLARDAAELVATLNQPAGETGIETMGDPLLLERTFTAVPASEVAKQFGEKFAASLGHVAPGRWEGPVESGFGAHVVFVVERTSGRLPPLQDVREAVIREWKNASRLDANEKIFREMLKRYTVTIEGQEPAEAAQLTRRQ